MSKMLKAIAMLLVIAAVVFAAGCANKAPATENNTTPAAPAETNVSAVTPAGTNESTVTPGETPVVIVNTTETNATVITENNTSAPAATGATHLSTAQRHQALKKSQEESNATENVTVKTVE